MEKLSNCSENYSQITNNEVNNYVKEAQNILLDAAKAAGMLKNKRKNRTNLNTNKKPWFDDDCKRKRKLYNTTKKKR